MSTWVSVLIGVGIVSAVSALFYVVWRWGGKKLAISKGALTVSGFVLGFLKSFFRDDPDKVDAYDFIAAGEEISSKLSVILEKHQKGLSFLETRDEMVEATKNIIAQFPHLDEKLTDEIIEKIVDGALALISNIPKVKDIVKK